jgi:agmatinase
MNPAFDPSAPATGNGIYGLPFSPEQSRVVLVPVPWEPTTSYGRGASLGPEAIRRASRQVDLFDVETGRPYEAGVALLDVDPEIAAWNTEAMVAAEPILAAGGTSPDLEASTVRVNGLSERLNARVAQIVREHQERDKLVGVIGGDHSCAFGAIEASASRWPGLGVLHLDAHADLREAYQGFTYSHASIMLNVVTRLPNVARVVQVGLRDLSEEEYGRIRSSKGRVRAVFDQDLARQMLEGKTFASILRNALECLPDNVYLSFDIDGLDASLCPHAGTRVPGGLSFQQAVALMAYLVESGRRIVGFDLSEVVPGPDGDEWDGNVGARLLYKMIGLALMSQASKKASL